MSLALLLTLVVTQTEAERVLVIHTPSGAITERQSKLYQAHLRLELAKHDGVMLAQGSLPAGNQDECVKEPTCLAQLASSTGADTVVFARTARLGEDSVVTMKRLRIASGVIEQTATRQLEGGNGEEMLTAIGPMVTELFPREALRTGTSEGVSREHVVRWSPPPLKPWVFWTSAGATVVSGALIGVFAAQKADAQNDFDDAIQSGAVVNGARLREIQDRAENAATRTNVFIGVTAGLAATTAIIAYFTDWHADRDSVLLGHF